MSRPLALAFWLVYQSGFTDLVLASRSGLTKYWLWENQIEWVKRLQSHEHCSVWKNMRQLLELSCWQEISQLSQNLNLSFKITMVHLNSLLVPSYNTTSKVAEYPIHFFQKTVAEQGISYTHTSLGWDQVNPCLVILQKKWDKMKHRKLCKPLDL